MAVLELYALPQIRKEYQNKKIVFCSGVFDLTHAGHVLFFEDCKKIGDILIVGIGRDKIIKKDKGKNRPILNEHIRLKMVDSLKAVDYTLFFQDLSLLNKKPYNTNTLAFLESLFDRLKPNVYAVNEDASNNNYRKELCIKKGIEFCVLNRNCLKEYDKISTSKIIDKIKDLK